MGWGEDASEGQKRTGRRKGSPKDFVCFVGVRFQGNGFNLKYRAPGVQASGPAVTALLRARSE